MISVDVPVTSVMLSGDREDKFIVTFVEALVPKSFTVGLLRGDLPMCLAASNSFNFGLLRGDFPICLDEPFLLIQLASFLDTL
jgi:hypothetical protein